MGRLAGQLNALFDRTIGEIGPLLVPAGARIPYDRAIALLRQKRIVEESTRFDLISERLKSEDMYLIEPWLSPVSGVSLTARAYKNLETGDLAKIEFGSHPRNFRFLAALTAIALLTSVLGAIGAAVGTKPPMPPQVMLAVIAGPWVFVPVAGTFMAFMVRAKGAEQRARIRKVLALS